MTRALPSREEITPETPLRLEVAARLHFPDGSISGRSLEREAAKGNLIVIRIAGKAFTTLSELTKMCEKCRSQPSQRDSTSAQPETTASRSGSSWIEASSTAQARAK